MLTVKRAQEHFKETVTEIDGILMSVERKTLPLETVENKIHYLSQSISQFKDVNVQLRSKQAELVDMQRRDKLLFYGLSETHSDCA